MDSTGDGRQIEILLVEDNPGDVRLTMELFKECKIRNKMHVVNDGVEAMAFLRKEGVYADVPRPDLILLDLNLPRMDGREVLVEVKKDKTLMRIPVVVLTISKAEEDILTTYDSHANCFITKPVNLDQFVKVVQSIEDFWLSIVKLPPNGNM
ncbi:MAG: response regulator [Thermoplasmata archaeon]|nr:response regulator [Thermoplasmata archaeon]